MAFTSRRAYAATMTFVTMFVIIATAQSTRSCSWSASPRSLIRVKESRSNGAEYVHSSHALDANECERLCCERAPNCDLAVFKQLNILEEFESKTNCYLFACGTPSKCYFASHPLFTSASLATTATTQSPTSSTPEPKATTPNAIERWWAIIASATSPPPSPTSRSVVSTTTERLVYVTTASTTARTTTPTDVVTEELITEEPTKEGITTLPVQRATSSVGRTSMHTKAMPSASSSSAGSINTSDRVVDLSEGQKSHGGGLGAGEIVAILGGLCLTVIAIGIIVYRVRKSRRLGGYYSHDDYLINGMYT